MSEERTLRGDAWAIFDAGVDAVAPGPAVTRALEAEPLQGEPFVIAVGKAASAMARAAREAGAGEGLIVTTVAGARPMAGFEVRVGDHPEPGAGSLAGGWAVEQALHSRDNLLVLVSGGASAMVAAPSVGLSLDDLVHTSDVLTRRGVDIHDLNTIRRHLSRIKGGQALQEEQQVRALLLSDVVGDDPATIGSGLAAPDSTTFADALAILRRHGLMGAMRPTVVAHLELGECGGHPDTPEPGSPQVANLKISVVASVRDAAEGARTRAETLGYEAIVLTTTLSGEARDAAAWLADQEIPDGPTALIAGGETTVTVRGRGRGGRSQELALAFAGLRQAAPTDRPWALLSAGTDGRDGPTDAAGAIIDAEVVGALGDVTEALANNDSYSALDAAGGLLRTGATGTNVGDLVVLLVGE